VKESLSEYLLLAAVAEVPLSENCYFT